MFSDIVQRYQDELVQSHTQLGLLDECAESTSGSLWLHQIGSLVFGQTNHLRKTVYMDVQRDG